MSQRSPFSFLGTVFRRGFGAGADTVKSGPAAAETKPAVPEPAAPKPAAPEPAEPEPVFADAVEVEAVQPVAIAETPAEPPETVTFHSMSTDRALWRVLRRGLQINTVIDVGASNGMWSAVCEKHLPDSHYLLVEAQDVHREALNTYCGARPRVDYVLAAAGDKLGEIYFDSSDPFGGVASHARTADTKVVVPVTTLDHEIATRGLPGPYLVKLDTHGFEVPILEGARHVLANAELVIIETYNFRLSDTSLLFHEMVDFMRQRGFGVSDVSEPLWRDHDGAFWQFDLFFQPLARSEFKHNAYR